MGSHTERRTVLGALCLQVLDFLLGGVLAEGAEDLSEAVVGDGAVAALVVQGECLFDVCVCA